MQDQVQVKVQFSDWMSDGFEFFTGKIGPWLINAVIMLVVLMPMFIIMFVPAVLSGVLNEGNRNPSGAQLVTMLGGMGAGIVILMLISVGLTAGLYNCALIQMRGGDFGVGDMFKGFKYFGSFLLMGMIMGLVAIPLMLMCFFPVFLLAPIGLLAPFLIIDRGMGALEAIQEAHRKSKDDFWMLLLFAFVASLIGQLFQPITTPILMTMGVIAYREMYMLPGSRSAGVDTTPPAGGFGGGGTVPTGPGNFAPGQAPIAGGVQAPPPGGYPPPSGGATQAPPPGGYPPPSGNLPPGGYPPPGGSSNS